MPSIDLPYGAEVEEVLGVTIGGVDSYDFHALEMIQCMAERRRGSINDFFVCLAWYQLVYPFAHEAPMLVACSVICYRFLSC